MPWSYKHKRGQRRAPGGKGGGEGRRARTKGEGIYAKSEQTAVCGDETGRNGGTGSRSSEARQRRRVLALLLLLDCIRLPDLRARTVGSEPFSQGLDGSARMGNAPLVGRSSCCSLASRPR